MRVAYLSAVLALMLAADSSIAQCIADHVLAPVPAPSSATMSSMRGDRLVLRLPDYGGVLVYRAHGVSLDLETFLPADQGPSSYVVALATDGDTVAALVQYTPSGSPTLRQLATWRLSEKGWASLGTLALGDADWPAGGLAVAGDWIALGRPEEDAGGSDAAGVVRLYHRDSGTGWSFHSELTAPTPLDDDGFGSALAITGGSLLVGTWNKSPSVLIRPVFAFELQGESWLPWGQLLPHEAPPTQKTQFGRDVAIDLGGGVAAIGSGTTSGQGSAYAFERIGGVWTQTAKLPPVGGGPADDFYGLHVAVSDGGTDIVVGSPLDGAVGLSIGAVHVFRRELGGWSGAALLTQLPAGNFGWHPAAGASHAVALDPVYGPVTLITGLGPAASDDCNENGVPDLCDIAGGTSADVDHDGVPDECLIVTDFNADGIVDAVDLAVVLGGWGPCAGCGADSNSDGSVDAVDIANVLGAWTAIPPRCEGSGDCCEPSAAPGCGDQSCCTEVCVSDPYCCDTRWDAPCALLAQDVCACLPPIACDEGSTSCCQAGGVGGCDDPECCQTLCAADPGCCLVAWDQACADAALVLCASCIMPLPCNPAGGDCCVDWGGWGCGDAACCSLICGFDPFCCCVVWDQICADEANVLCEVCNGG